MMQRRWLLSGLLGATAVAVWARRARASNQEVPATRETIAILGTGHLGGALGKRLGALGYPLVYGARRPGDPAVKALVNGSGPAASATSPAAAVARARIVVFALPWEPVPALLPTLGDLSGKLVIDPMNAKARIVEGYPFRPDANTSVAEALQAALPAARVVKAFNAIAAQDLANAAAPGPISIPIAGADLAAKARVMQLVAELKLDPVDFGPLIVARYIEDLLWFEVACVRNNRRMSELYLRRMPA